MQGALGRPNMLIINSANRIVLETSDDKLTAEFT
jgi:hypothetical protein